MEPITAEDPGIQCRRPCAQVFHQRCMLNHLKTQRLRPPKELPHGQVKRLPETCPSCRENQPVFDSDITNLEVSRASYSIFQVVFSKVLEEIGAEMQDLAESEEAASEQDEQFFPKLERFFKMVRTKCRDLVYEKIQPHVIPGCEESIKSKLTNFPTREQVDKKICAALETRETKLRIKRIQRILEELKPRFRRQFRIMIRKQVGYATGVQTEVSEFSSFELIYRACHGSAFQTMELAAYQFALRNTLKGWKVCKNMVKAVQERLKHMCFNMDGEAKAIETEVCNMFATDEAAQELMDAIKAHYERSSKRRRT